MQIGEPCELILKVQLHHLDELGAARRRAALLALCSQKVHHIRAGIGGAALSAPVRDKEHVALPYEEVGEWLQTPRQAFAAMIPENRWEWAVAGRLKQKSMQSDRAARERDFLGGCLLRPSLRRRRLRVCDCCCHLQGDQRTDNETSASRPRFASAIHGPDFIGTNRAELMRVVQNASIPVTL